MIYYESHNINFEDENSVAQHCAMAGKAILDVVVAAIEYGINDGSIRPGIDPNKTAISLWGQSTGIIQIVALKEVLIMHSHEITAEDIVDYTYNLIHHSLKA